MSSALLMDVNLLPKRDSAGPAFKTAIVVLVLLAILGTIGLSVTYYILNHSLTIARQEVDMTKKLRTAAEKKLVQGNTGSGAAANGLKSMIPLVQQLPISAVSVLNQFASLLPERGFVLNYQYNESSVNMTVRFDTLYETSAFLNRLNRSEWVESVVMPGIAGAAEDLGAKIDTALKAPAVITVPKYTATFQIKLNRKAIKDMEGKGK